MAKACGVTCDGVCDVGALGFMKGRGFRERLHLAIGVRGGCAALCTGGETTVYAVSVCIVGDDKGASLGIRRAGEAQQNDKTGQKSVHWGGARGIDRRPASRGQCHNARKIVKRRLTLSTDGGSSNFSRILHEFRDHLDGLHATNHCAAMNGLNHICGICREIIR
jgi:hypothetical protein